MLNNLAVATQQGGDRVCFTLSSLTPEPGILDITIYSLLEVTVQKDNSTNNLRKR